MSEALYEKHNYTNKSLPIIFHTDELNSRYSSVFSHWHDSLELLFIVEGSAVCHIDTEEVEVHKGDILAVNSQSIHSLNTKNGFTYYHCLIIYKEICEQFGFDLKKDRLNSVIRDEKIFGMIEDLAKEYRAKKPYYSARTMACALNILAGLYAGYSSEVNFTDKSRKLVMMVKSGIDYISQNYMKKINVAEIAEHAGYSKYHFCRVFKQFTGETVVEHISRLKIDEAYTMLLKGESIRDAAMKCGIDDVSYFTKLFKRYKKVLPSAIAKKRKDEE